jgi:DNA replication and repair protein RecF
VRNLRPLQLLPRERFNVFSGDNGQGKTNLLEAIFVVAALRSFRTARRSDVIAFGADRARRCISWIFTAGARVAPG